MKKKKGYIGIDLDGTLAHSGTRGTTKIGAPVSRMVERVKKMLADGKDVRILTARVAPSVPSKKRASEREKIRAWLNQYFGRSLRIQAHKDPTMHKLYDDRAVGIKKNTGRNK